MVQAQPVLQKIKITGYQQAWEMAVSQLRIEMTKALFETWVQPLRPLGYEDGLFRIGVLNPYAREWVESRLKTRLVNLLEGILGESLTVQIDVVIDDDEEDANDGVVSTVPLKELASQTGVLNREKKKENGARKVMLQRAYGSKRASIIQPERGLFVTLYFFNNWLPLLGASAINVILAARSMCYWNPLTGELRNEIETDMADLAQRAAVSVRTVKDILSNELIKRYFLRYRVRRMMTPNGIRTAGILLQVRMDDPLTPEDQITHDLPETDHWYTSEFEDETDDD